MSFIFYWVSCISFKIFKLILHISCRKLLLFMLNFHYLLVYYEPILINNYSFTFINVCTQYKQYTNKCLWGVRGKDRGWSLQEEILHTYRLILDYSRISLFVLKKKKKKLLQIKSVFRINTIFWYQLKIWMTKQLWKNSSLLMLHLFRNKIFYTYYHVYLGI